MREKNTLTEKGEIKTPKTRRPINVWRYRGRRRPILITEWGEGVGRGSDYISAKILVLRPQKEIQTFFFPSSIHKNARSFFFLFPPLLVIFTITSRNTFLSFFHFFPAEWQHLRLSSSWENLRLAYLDSGYRNFIIIELNNPNYLYDLRYIHEFLYVLFFCKMAAPDVYYDVNWFIVRHSAFF